MKKVLPFLRFALVGVGILFVIIIVGSLWSSARSHLSNFKIVGREFHAVAFPGILNGELYYIGTNHTADSAEGYLNSYLVRGDKKIRLEKFFVQKVITIGDRIGIWAADVANGNRGVILVDGEPVSARYGNAFSPIAIDGALAYVAERAARQVDRDYHGLAGGWGVPDDTVSSQVKSFVVRNGQEDDFGLDRVSKILNVAGRLAVVGWRGNKHVLKYQDREYTADGYTFTSVHTINNQLAFIKSKLRSNATLIYTDAAGSEQKIDYQDSDYQGLGAVVEVNGKPAIGLSSHAQIIYNGTVYGRADQYGLGPVSSTLTTISNKVAFIEHQLEGNTLVIGGKKLLLPSSTRDFPLKFYNLPSDLGSKFYFQSSHADFSGVNKFIGETDYAIGGFLRIKGRNVYRVANTIGGHASIVIDGRPVGESKSLFWGPGYPFLLGDKVAFFMNRCSGLVDCTPLSYLVIEK